MFFVGALICNWKYRENCHSISLCKSTNAMHYAFQIHNKNVRKTS